MIKIIFVCLGNICRSPMAEFIMKDIVKKNGLEDRFFIGSRATSDDEIVNGVGNPVYGPARDELAKHGLDCCGKTAQRLKKSDYDKYDIFIGMDSMNIRDMESLFDGDPQGKIHKMSEFSGTGRDVADPWFYGHFDVTYDDVLRGCTAIFDRLK